MISLKTMSNGFGPPPSDVNGGVGDGSDEWKDIDDNSNSNHRGSDSGDSNHNASNSIQRKNSAKSVSTAAAGVSGRSPATPTPLSNGDGLRANRSQAVPTPPPDRASQKLRKDARAKSMQESELQLGLKLRERTASMQSRTVSFNGISVVIDSLMASYSTLLSKGNLDALISAVKLDDLDGVRRLISEDSVNLADALFAAVELNREDILEELLADVKDINLRHEESGLGLLHKAAASGALECVRLLLSRGADATMWDRRREVTPLHMAASGIACSIVGGHNYNTALGTPSVQVMQLLVNNGANINAGSDCGDGDNTVLHAAVRVNNIAAVRFLLDNKVETVTKTFSETALHTAAELNHHEAARLLLQQNPMLVDRLRGEKERKTALHIAAESDLADTAEVLLNFGADVAMRTSDGSTPLHLAAKNQSSRVLCQLLKQINQVDAGLINARDADGRTPLFVCTATGGRGRGTGDSATECMEEMLRNRAAVDEADNMGDTPLHMAAKDRNAERVNLLIRHEADLSLKNNAGFSALYFINKKVPQCVRSFQDRLDTGLEIESEDDGMGTSIKLDFNKLSANMFMKQDITIFMELLNTPHQEQLKHPLAQAFLYLKWNQMKYLYLVGIVLNHFIFSSVLTLYALLLYCSLCIADDAEDNGVHRWHFFTSYVHCRIADSPTLNLTRAAWICLLIFLPIYFFKELLKLAASPKTYFRQWESYHDLVIISTSVVIAWLDLFEEEIFVGRWQYHAACIGTFATWLYMMFLIGRVPRFGKYVQMFRTVALSVLNFMVAYIFLLLAFASSFMIVFPGNEAFALLPSAFIKLVVMMLGEIDYADLYYSENLTIKNGDKIVKNVVYQPFPLTAHFFLLLFTVLVSIILMNLLVGLAVSDIQGLSKSAKLDQLVQQVNLINYTERILFSPYFRYLPDRIQNFLRTKLQGLQGHCKKVFTVRPYDINDRSLPESLKKAIHDNCIRRVTRTYNVHREREIEDMRAQIQRILQLLENGGVVGGGGGGEAVAQPTESVTYPSANLSGLPQPRIRKTSRHSLLSGVSTVSGSVFGGLDDVEEGGDDGGGGRDEVDELDGLTLGQLLNGRRRSYLDSIVEEGTATAASAKVNSFAASDVGSEAGTVSDYIEDTSLP